MCGGWPFNYGGTDDNGKMITPPGKAIIAAYSAITGYNPATVANDNGAVELNVLKYWRKKGIAGHKIIAFAALEPRNNNHVMQEYACLAVAT